ncbi:unnamed protein product [Phytophthora fragariaefolia]|uniref:Unnamed protein product n=1 Tax=Phytophthora fragariaefolia TaxID=1490495 RepID=A0A9W7D269_9STRA|nr:unnamed protein product [Phytophthora fragariaefolia]
MQQRHPFRRQITSEGELSKSAAPLSRPRSAEVGDEGVERAGLGGGSVELITESSGPAKDSAVGGVGELAVADSAPALEALGEVSEVEPWPPGRPELGDELGTAVSATDDANGGAAVGETAGAASAGDRLHVETG